MAEGPSRTSADSVKEEVIHMIQHFLEYIAGMSERMPFTVDRQKFRSITTLAAVSVAIYFIWKILRAPPAHQRRQHRQSNEVPAASGSRSSSNSGLVSSAYCSSADLRPQDRVELFPPGKMTLEQTVRYRLNEGRKDTLITAMDLPAPTYLPLGELSCGRGGVVRDYNAMQKQVGCLLIPVTTLHYLPRATCRLLGVVLEETTSEELQEHAIVKSSVREILLEITKFSDLYLMERTMDDESEERVLLALKDAGLFISGGLNSEKVLFSSTEKGRISFVRQLEPDWHIDTNPDIIHQLARFIKYQLLISPTRIEHAASNVFHATCLENFFGVSDRS